MTAAVALDLLVAADCREAVQAQLSRYRALAVVDARYAPMVARLEGTVAELDRAMAQIHRP